MREILTDKEESVLSKINAERVVYYWAKYYHVQAKNLARELYHQRAYETFNEGLAYLK